MTTTIAELEVFLTEPDDISTLDLVAHVPSYVSTPRRSTIRYVPVRPRRGPMAKSSARGLGARYAGPVDGINTASTPYFTPGGLTGSRWSADISTRDVPSGISASGSGVRNAFKAVPPLRVASRQAQQQKKTACDASRAGGFRS
jgi:hypothetical protein